MSLTSRIATEMRQMDGCPGCSLDHGACVRHPDSLRHLAVEVVLGLDLTPARRAHTFAVGRRAAELALDAGRSSYVTDLLAAAGTLHDVGYAFPDTGHHAIDGARWLALHCFPADLIGLVAHHSTSFEEAAVRGLGDELNEFARTDERLHTIIWAADFSTSPTGSLVTVAERVAEIRSRYPVGGDVVLALDAAEPRMRELFARHLPRVPR